MDIQLEVMMRGMLFYNSQIFIKWQLLVQQIIIFEWKKHGGLDDNVNPSATFKLAEALVDIDKEFDFT